MASSWCRKATSLVVFGLMGVTGTGIYDDYLVFKQCSTKAIAKARNDPRLMRMIGDYVDQGPWYEATMDTAHEGHSATCRFPVHGTHGSAKLCVRAVRYEERMSSQFYYVWPGQGQWEMLVLEALIPQPNKEDTIRIDLLQDP
ncbi:hypothetical protein M758_3G042800 [Ceratodon purpureus]|uniref:Uncharacterized protein n=1 Tax=Ceratodon purpureus TaxID=3225 RepID=A0A8T0IEP1_CERPU|nr:hypothetical protein KC19_3G044100 [Ceratodon purpureus]KAG0621710.1 hypothetical protein M758_3G042800 [Ceratodon purpureus]